MSTPLIVPETFVNGPAGNTPLDAEAMNSIWSALMQALLDQLVSRKTSVDASINAGDMIVADASNAPVHLQAPPASVRGNWGVRKDDLTPNPIIITAQGTDVLDEDGATTYTIVSPGDDVVFSYNGPGHFSLVRRSAATRPATSTTFGTLRFGATSDLVGPADSITVPGKENVGVANTLVGQHTVAPDPHGDRVWSQQNAGQQIATHASAGDPHGDRAWALNNLVPRSWFDAQGQLLPSHTASLSIINTYVVNSQAAMLALNVQTGDVAIRTDAASSGGQRTYILQGSDPTQLSSWTVMPSIGAVSSVRGAADSTAMTGDVVLGPSNVGAAPAIHRTNHAPGGSDDLSNSYVALNTVGVGGGVAAYNDTRLVNALQAGSKNVANGVAGLDATARVPMSNSGNPIPNTTVYTAATNPHTPLQGELAQYNAVNNAITQTLPPAPTSVSTITILELKNQTPTSSGNTVTFTPVGTDTVDGNTAGNGGSFVLRGYGEVRRIIGYMGNWMAEGGLNTYAALDMRYAQINTVRQIPVGGSIGQMLVKTGTADGAVGWGTGSLVPNPPIDQPFATSMTPNATVGNYRTTTCTADFTFNPPANPTDGQLYRHRFLASGAQRTMTLGAGFRLPQGMTSTLVIPSGRRGDVGLVYDASDGTGAWTVLSAQAQAT